MNLSSDDIMYRSDIKLIDMELISFIPSFCNEIQQTNKKNKITTTKRPNIGANKFGAGRRDVDGSTQLEIDKLKANLNHVLHEKSNSVCVCFSANIKC